MNRFICLVWVINFLVISFIGMPYCSAADSKYEVNWEHLTHGRSNETASMHILEKVSQKNNRSIYRGITITHPYGHITTDNQQTKDSSAIGVGPAYLIRNETKLSAKLKGALDMSGGFLVYNKAFPAEGRAYNFMWRVGPRFIYKVNENSSLNIGYMLMHVSNGLRTHNPGYNAHGVSLGFVRSF